MKCTPEMVVNRSDLRSMKCTLPTWFTDAGLMIAIKDPHTKYSTMEGGPQKFGSVQVFLHKVCYLFWSLVEQVMRLCHVLHLHLTVTYSSSLIQPRLLFRNGLLAFIWCIDKLNTLILMAYPLLLILCHNTILQTLVCLFTGCGHTRWMLKYSRFCVMCIDTCTATHNYTEKLGQSYDNV